MKRKDVRVYLIFILFLVGIASCYEALPEREILEFNPWNWSKCLPSASDNNCDGEKPSWELYRTEGIIVWRYGVDGRKVYHANTIGNSITIYERLYCLNYKGDTTGTSFNVGFFFPSKKHDPVSGKVPECDAHGPLDGEIMSIYGIIDTLNGRVIPISW